jgi:hypothetical protein
MKACKNVIKGWVHQDEKGRAREKLHDASQLIYE